MSFLASASAGILFPRIPPIFSHFPRRPVSIFSHYFPEIPPFFFSQKFSQAGLGDFSKPRGWEFPNSRFENPKIPENPQNLSPKQKLPPNRIAAIQKSSPNRNCRQTKMVAKQNGFQTESSPNRNGRRGKMVANRRYRQTEMIAKQK